MATMAGNSTEQIEEAHTESDVVFQNLYPALLQSFAIILIGYIASRFKFIPQSQCDGFTSYVSNVALPALLFQKMAMLSFGSIDWLFWTSILLAKGFIFILVFCLTLATSHSGTKNLGRAAILSMFATQTNDFALGYPLFVAIYKNSYPELPEYLYLFGPISLVCLNPFGFLALEIEKNNTITEMNRLTIVWKVFKGMLTNPMVVSVAVGVAVNLIFHQKVPYILDPIIRVLADSYAATALFCLGMSLVGKMQSMSGFACMEPLLLITAKQFMMPLSAVMSVNLLRPGAASNMTDVYSNYGFLYGTIPTTPSVFLYATKYEVLKNVVATSLFLVTLLSGLEMFVTGVMAVLPSMERSDYGTLLANVSFGISCVGIISIVVLLLFFIVRRCFRRFPHKVTINLFVAQMVACLGVMVCFFLNRISLANHICKFILLVGVLAIYMWTTALALGLCLLRIGRSSLLQRFLWCFYLYGWGFPLCLAVILLVVEWLVIQDDVAFVSENYQVVMSTTVLFLNILLTVSSLVIMWKYDHYRGSENIALNTENTGPPSETSDVELVNFSSNTIGERPEEQRNGLREGTNFQKEHEEVQDAADATDQSDRGDPSSKGNHHQLGRHLTLLLFLVGCMCVSFVFNVWKQLSPWNNHPGTFVLLDFIDKLLTFGQGFVALLIFILDKQGILLPAYRLFRRWCHLPETFRRLYKGSVEDEVTLNCQNFLERYSRMCRASIADSTGKFQGADLVNWLQEEGLFEDAGSAERFADALLLGGAIKKAEGDEQIFDNFCYYLFVCSDQLLSVT
ncbi:hypothetical protein HOLleu_35481 [Holothuria leucospilota]|uniref:DEP domain-containing protein n=1 Tax=Holothuria leucospilota TaxID=206669 RepID=A0A9Q1BHS4_HOLLE|nr:hypothetical protein HOLleu_35481 [Holothuria leucospilota]